ncbi:hypothetical protein QR680_007425 [Steinernema hermaphroditum]|uniref:Uncharacterized protein n=1 Tax=Steinernema hermaphroditum TaxID=289476 RepID=A0AA39ID50_9BILA|nr:hypothetical protein QR680_007425 [Steinernema hermaphroditum]
MVLDQSKIQKGTRRTSARFSLSNFLLIREHNHPARLASAFVRLSPSVYAIGQQPSAEVRPLQQGEVQLTRAG